MQRSVAIHKEQSVDREASTLGFLFVVWMLLNLWDAVTTYLGLTFFGAREVNPFLSLFSPVVLIIVKLTIALLLGIYLVFTERKKYLIFGATMVGAVGVWNTFKLLSAM